LSFAYNQNKIILIIQANQFMQAKMKRVKDFLTQGEDDNTILIVGTDKIKLFANSFMLKFVNFFKKIFDIDMKESKLKESLYTINLPDESIDCVKYLLCGLYNVDRKSFMTLSDENENKNDKISNLVNFCKNYIIFCDKYCIDDPKFFKYSMSFINSIKPVYSVKLDTTEYNIKLIKLFDCSFCLHLPFDKILTLFQQKLYDIYLNILLWILDVVKNMWLSYCDYEETDDLINFLKNFIEYEDIFNNLFKLLIPNKLISPIETKAFVFLLAIIINKKIDKSISSIFVNTDESFLDKIIDFCIKYNLKMKFDTFDTLINTTYIEVDRTEILQYFAKYLEYE
jgi:hypothetical protein